MIKCFSDDFSDSRTMARFIITSSYLLLIVVGCLSIYGSTKSRVIRRGTDLDLNCSNYCIGCMWWFGGLPLYNYTTAHNNTLVLKIHNTTFSNQGVYWCGSSWQQGYNVAVIIGDLPSPPRNVKTTSFDWNKFIHWTASTSTGGLPVQYAVKMNCVENSSSLECGTNSYEFHKLDDCGPFMHRKGKQYKCDLSQADRDTQYNACVIAVNQVGSSSTCIPFKRYYKIETAQTIPNPPPNFKAREIRQGYVQLSWELHAAWNDECEGGVKCFIIISLSKKGDKINTTLPKRIPVNDKTVTISHLHADSYYTFYAVAQFVVTNEASKLSIPADATLHTRYIAPDQPPQNIQCNDSRSDSNGKRNITLWWQPPEVQHQNGPISHYLVYVSSYDGKSNETKLVGSSMTRVVLPGFDDDKDVSFGVRACTEGHDLCSGISESCTVQGMIKEKAPGTWSEAAIIVLAVACVIIALLIIIGVLLYLRKKSRLLKQRRASLSSIESITVYVDKYDNPEGSSGDNNVYATASPSTSMDIPLITPRNG